MHTSNKVLPASLALNLLLVFAIAGMALRRPHAAPHQQAAAIRDRRTAGARLDANDPLPPLAPAAATASASEQRRWVVEQLRAAGVQNEVLARMVIFNLEETSEERGRELAKICRGDRATMAELQLQFEKTRDAEIRAALGEEGFRQWDERNMLRELDGGGEPLTAAEREAVYALWKQRQHQELAAKEARLHGALDDAQAAESEERVSTEYNRQLKSLLGDERYARAQQMDAGAAAESLRRDFAAASPTASQVQELLAAQQTWSQRRAELERQLQATDSGAIEDRLRALDQARDEEYRRIIGPDAFNQLQKEQDPGYARMKKFAEAWALDDAKIDYVYGTLRDYQKTVQDYQAQARALEAGGQNVDWTAVKRNLQAFADQTQQALQSSLGAERLAKLQRNGVVELNPVQLPGGRPF